MNRLIRNKTIGRRPSAMLLAVLALTAVAATGTAIVFAISGPEPAGEAGSETTSLVGDIPIAVETAGSRTDTGTEERVPVLAMATPPSTVLSERDSSDSGGDQNVYIALGDSLAVGVGASNVDLGYVGVFHHRLELIEGRPIRLLNLGVSGATSAEILAEQLPLALREIQRLRDDGDPTTSVSIVTLNAGGNDLRGALGLRVCLSDLLGEPCLEGLNAIAEVLMANLQAIIDPLLERPGEPPVVYLMNLYSLSDERLGSFQQVLDFVTAILNEAIIEAGDRTGAIVVDVSTIFRNRLEELTNVAAADIHPNDAGHRELAGALLRAAANQEPLEG